MSPYKIIKFGGSSVSSPERIRNVLTIVDSIAQKSPRLGVVVSAFGGVTDQLITLGKTAAQGDASYQQGFEDLSLRHHEAAEALIHPHQLSHAQLWLHDTLFDLANILAGVSLIRELSPKSLDLIMSFGERLSAYIVSQAGEMHFVDARNIIKTDRTFGEARVNFHETNQQVQHYFGSGPKLSIITGFVASSHDNQTTTLGRGGSDYTAAILGAALQAESIEIWTDVDGVMTADPRKEPFAFPILQMSYNEAMEMSHFGAKVIHPPTIAPALEKGIPLLIKNSFNPQAVGTLISPEAKNASSIRGISSIDHAALLSVQGTGLIGVCGMARRLFGALADKGINIILISQGSSEHSICFAVTPAHAELAKEAIEKEFALEIQARLLDAVNVTKNLSVIAVVGENMRRIPGISGKLFNALGRNAINVIAIAQGSSELNISVVVKKEDEVKAIRVIHEAFFLSPRKTVHVFLAGVGLIGAALLDQLQNSLARLQKEHALDIKLNCLMNSQKMSVSRDGIPLEQWRDSLQMGKAMHTQGCIDQIIEMNLNNGIFVDCTSSQEVADAYPRILEAGISIVTPNKKANSGKLAAYKKLRQAASKSGASFYYGPNVGAGLPIISTLQELVQSGDVIIKIEAILSGTLSYLFNSFMGEKSFSEVVKEAQAKGYTEPDPKDDLSGQDVARKLLILARECGYALEPEEIALQPLFGNDQEMESLLKQAQKQGKRLRYLASLVEGKGNIGLQAIGPEHPFYTLSGSDNIIAIHSEFYSPNPLVIKGPGAGAEVTARKVLADIIKKGTSS